MNNQIQKAVEVLNKGGIIIFPTDTAYGIGCRIDKVKSIEKLFKLRKRPYTQATPVLISSTKMAKDYVLQIPKDVESELINKFWPGALTVVFLAKIDKIPSLVRGGGKNIGVRMPNNSIMLEIIEKVGVPLLGPSANFHGEKTPFRIEDVDKNLLKQVDFVVVGECSLKNISTVIDCTTKPWKTLRQGALKIKNLSYKKALLLINTSNNKDVTHEISSQWQPHSFRERSKATYAKIKTSR